ncbi:MAG: FAD binding domain-containing protein [Anaerolineales bacterium]
MLEPHVALPEFDYVKPASLEEASQFLAAHSGESRPLLGGTDIFVRMRDGHWKDKYLVDVKGLEGTTDLEFDKNNGLVIGAAVPMNQVIKFEPVAAHYPLLVEAARTVASYQLRSRATIIGNICNASPAGDTIGACIVYDGILTVHGVDGSREISLREFFHGPGQTALAAGDIVTSIRLPLPPQGAEGSYVKLGRNQLGDLAIVGVTALGYPDEVASSGYRFRLVLAAVAPTPLIPNEAEALLAEGPINDETIEQAGVAAMSAAAPIDDVRGGAEYRRLMARNLTQRALTRVWEKLS